MDGAYDNFLRIPCAARVIDARDRWVGGSTYLVQTGDVLDRGPGSRRALDLLRRLERDAQKARGRVMALVGNHGVMRMLGDFRDINPLEIDAFRTAGSSEIAPAGAPPGFKERPSVKQRLHPAATAR